MATEKLSVGPNVFQSSVGCVTVSGKAHGLSAWFVLALRLMMGYAFLYSGITKLIAPEPFDASGYLTHVAAANGNPLAGVFVWMGSTPWFVDFANVAVPWGELLIGIGLVVGALVRLAAFFGALMMLLFYFGNWSVDTASSTVTSPTCSCSSPWPPSAQAASSASTPSSSSTRSTGRRSSRSTRNSSTSSGASRPRSAPLPLATNDTPVIVTARP